MMRYAQLLLFFVALPWAADKSQQAAADQAALNGTVQKVLQLCDAQLKAQHYAEAIAGYTQVLGVSNADPKLLNAARVGLAEAQIGKAAADTAAAPTPMPMAELNKAVRSILHDADKALAEHRYADAVAGYTEVLASTGTDPKLLNQARLGKAKASMAKSAADNPSGLVALWQSVTTAWKASIAAIGTILFWIAVLLLVLFIRSSLPARDGLLITLDDLSATDRTSASAQLSQELQQLLSPSPSGGGEMLFESMTDFEGGGLAAIKPIIQMPGLDPSMLATAAVTLGPFQVTPAGLLALGRSLTAPRYKRVLSGTLFQQAPRTILTAQILSRSGAPFTPTVWQATDDSADARRSVLRRIAARVAIALADGNCVTQVPQSLECTLDGIDRLRSSGASAGSADALNGARTAFQAAVAHDPENWLALFNLTVLARQLGDYDTAIQHCLTLEGMLNRKPLPKSLAKCLETHPEFPTSILYNHALALAKQEDWRSNKEAVRLLDFIIKDDDGPLKPLAQSARAAALIFQFQRFREDKAEEREKAIRDDVKRCVDELNSLAATGNTRAIAIARAVALNAYGYILETSGDLRHAREQFEAAVAQDPQFVTAHINLGRLFRRGGRTANANWLVKAKEHFKQAVALQPENREANYQMGRLLADPAVGQFADALKSFDAAQPHSKAAFHAGEIYCDPGLKEFDLDQGIERLRIAVNLARTVDYRMESLVHHLLEAAESQIAQAAVTKAQANAAESPDEQKFCARARKLLVEAERDLAALPQTTDAERRRVASLSARCTAARQHFTGVCGQRPAAPQLAPPAGPTNGQPAA